MKRSGRIIPATMATQHPDHASVPFWKRDGNPFISAQEEVEECFINFKELRCQEFMWDWEGKHVDEAVVERLFSTHLDFFKRHRLGQDLFLTFRLPNIWLEKGYRLARAYMGILTFENLSWDLGFRCPPVFEVILPMTDHARKLLYLHRTFTKVAHWKQKTFSERRHGLNYLRVIPLIEGVPELTASRRILTDYLARHVKEYRRRPEYLRPFVARSDPALNAGLVPATVAAKIALSEYYRFGAKTGIPVYPIIGVGGPPFRGGLTPLTIRDFLKEYRGIRTVTLQSAFRYDYPKRTVMRAIEQLNRALPHGKPRLYTDREIFQGGRLIRFFTGPYQHSVERWAGMINRLAKEIPPRRERLLHIGLFGYARGMGGKRLPRAIAFDAALYSIGIPPEFIGTGRGLKAAYRAGLLPVLDTFYVNLRRDLIAAGRYLNRENLSFLIRQDRSWALLQEDIAAIETILKIEIGPKTTDHYHHRNLVSSAYLRWRDGKPIAVQVLAAAKIRGGLG